MILSKNYNIHGILTIQINTHNKARLPGLNFPLSYFETEEEIENPDIILNIGPFEPELNNSYIVDHKYHIRENYFYCSDTADGKASWKVEIIGFEEPPTTINFYGKIRGLHWLLAPDLLAQDLVLIPMIELILGLNGFMLLHAGGVSKNKHAKIFIGRAGSRKTTVILNSIEKGYMVLGDDRVILNLKNLYVYSFPIFPRVFEFTLMQSKNEKLSVYQRIRLLHFLRDDAYVLPSVWENTSAKLERVYYLGGTKRSMDEELSPNDTLLIKTLSNNIAELYTTVIPSILKRRKFPDYILAYSYIFPRNNWIKLYNNILKTKIGEALKSIPISIKDNIQELTNAL